MRTKKQNVPPEAVLLVGIPASGKSTFYRERFFDTHVRINLDMLKTRHREEALLRTCIQTLQSFVVDNTNALESERARYIALAKQAGFRITGYWFVTSLKEALARNKARPGKASIPTIGVINKARSFQPPQFAEGFDALYSVVTDGEGGFLVEPAPPDGESAK